MHVTIYHPGSDSEPLFSGDAGMTLRVGGLRDRPSISIQVITAHLETLARLKLTQAELLELVQAAGRAIDYIEAQTQPEGEHGAD